MFSASTARLVDGAAALGEAVLVQIKGADAPVPARQLLGMVEGHRVVGHFGFTGGPISANPSR